MYSARRGLGYDSAAVPAFPEDSDFLFGQDPNVQVNTPPPSPHNLLESFAFYGSARSDGSPRTPSRGNLLSGSPRPRDMLSQGVESTTRRVLTRANQTDDVVVKTPSEASRLQAHVESLLSEIRDIGSIVDEMASETVDSLMLYRSNSRSFARKTLDSIKGFVHKEEPKPNPTVASLVDEQNMFLAKAALEVAGYGRAFKLLSKNTQAVFFFHFTVAMLSLGGLALAHFVRWQSGNVGRVIFVLSVVGGYILNDICRKKLTTRKLAWALAGIIIYYSDAFKGTPNRELYDSIRENLALENVTMLHIASALAHNHRCYESNFTLWSCGHVKDNTEYLAPIIAKVFGSPHIWSNELNGATTLNLSYTGGRKIKTQLYTLRGARLTDTFRSGFSYLSQVFRASSEEAVPPEITELAPLDRSFLYLAYVELHGIRTAAERQKALEKDMGFNRLVDQAGVFAGFMTLVVHDASIWNTVNVGSDFLEGAFAFYRNVFPPEHELVLQEGLDMCKIVPCLGGKQDFAQPPPDPLVVYVPQPVTWETTVEVEKEVIVYVHKNVTVEVPQPCPTTLEPPKECPPPAEDNSMASYIAGVISGVCGVAISAMAFGMVFPPEVEEFED